MTGALYNPKGHATVGEHPKRASDGNLLLILGCYRDLVIAEITIKESNTKYDRLTSQAFDG